MNKRVSTPAQFMSWFSVMGPSRLGLLASAGQPLRLSGRIRQPAKAHTYLPVAGKPAEPARSHRDAAPLGVDVWCDGERCCCTLRQPGPRTTALHTQFLIAPQTDIRNVSEGHIGKGARWLVIGPVFEIMAAIEHRSAARLQTPSGSSAERHARRCFARYCARELVQH